MMPQWRRRRFYRKRKTAHRTERRIKAILVKGAIQFISNTFDLGRATMDGFKDIAEGE